MDIEDFTKKSLKQKIQLDLYYYILFQKLYNNNFKKEIMSIEKINEYNYYINKYCNNTPLFIQLEKIFSKKNKREEIFSKLKLPAGTKLSKKEGLKLIEYIMEEYNAILKRELYKIEKSTFLFLISQHMTYVSILSDIIITGSYTDIGNINSFEMLLEYISTNKEKLQLQALELTGTEKKRCEYLMQVALDEKNFNFKAYSSVDLDNLFLTQIFLIVDELIYWSSIEMMLKSDRASKRNIYFDGTQLELGVDFNNRIVVFSKLINNGGYVELDDIDSQKIYQEFKKVTGYNSSDIEKLAKEINSGEVCTIILTENQFIEQITKILGITSCQSKQLLDSLTLQKSEKNRISNDLFDIDNKLSARPIIIINDYYVTDIILLYGAIPYFKQRILTKKIQGANKIPDVLFRNRHEAELSIFQEKINSKYKNGVNFDLMLFKEFRNALQNVKNITKEIDFYFIKEKTMYLIEYKDFTPELNIVFMNKVQSKLEKEFFKKHMKLRVFLTANRDVLSTILTSEIKYFKSFFVFKSRTAIPEFLYHKDVELYNKDEFMEFLKTI